MSCPSACVGKWTIHCLYHSRVTFAGLTVAEHFRDAEGQDVLLFIDNIFRFTQVPLLYLFSAIHVLLQFTSSFAEPYSGLHLP